MYHLYILFLLVQMIHLMYLIKKVQEIPNACFSFIKLLHEKLNQYLQGFVWILF